MSSLEKSAASQKLQDVGVSEQMADLLLQGNLAKNEDGTYNAGEVEELKERVAAKLSELNALVKKYDSEETGFITADDAQKLIKEQFKDIPDDTVERTVGYFEKDGKVDAKQLIEFLLFISDRKDGLLKFFDELDTDKSGFLEQEELENQVDEQFFACYPNYVKKIFKSLDENNDGKISKEEFLAKLCWVW